MEYLKQVAGIDIKHVPYKGTGPNVTDLDRRPHAGRLGRHAAAACRT